MRRHDREVTSLEEIEAIIAKCDCCRLALNSPDGYPYLLPLNFGYRREPDGRITRYFHSAIEGMKHEIIARDPRASVEMDCEHDLFSVAERGYCTMNYASVIGRGRIEYVTDEQERIDALTLLTDRYHTGHFEFSHAAIPRTSVYKLALDRLTAKRKSTAKKNAD